MDLEKGKRKTETGKHEWYGELRVGGARTRRQPLHRLASQRHLGRGGGMDLGASKEAALSVHAEHSQRPSRLAPVSYAACRMESPLRRDQ